METDCLVSGLAQCWEFTTPRRVCELDSVVTRDTSGSHFLGPLKGSSVWKTSSWFLSGQELCSPTDACCFCSCVLLLCSSRPERLLQKIILTAWPLEYTLGRAPCLDVALWGPCWCFASENCSRHTRKSAMVSNIVFSNNKNKPERDLHSYMVFYFWN